MGWVRMQSENEKKQGGKIRGFMSFTEGSCVQGQYESARIKPDGRGFFLLTLTEPASVNVNDSPTGQAIAQPGEVVAIRKTSATKIISEFRPGTLIRVSYVSLVARPARNPKNGEVEIKPYHHITIDVFEEEVA